MNTHGWDISQANAILEDLPCGVVILDREMRIVEHNRAFAEVYGESVGRPCFQVYKDRDTPCPKCLAQDTFEDGKSRVLEESGLDRNGQTIHYLARVVALPDATGKIDRVAAITSDLTATKRLPFSGEAKTCRRSTTF